MSLDIEVYSVIIEFMDLKDIIYLMMSLSRDVREQVMTDNYIIFKKFIRHFCMNKRMKKSDMPAYVDVFKLIKDNALCSRYTKPNRLQPFVFYTDGGVDNDSWCYFMDKLF